MNSEQFEIWLSDIDKLANIKDYSNELLWNAFNLGFSPDEFYYCYIELPF